ncbi:hypothetical protein D3C86_2130920 [compost metagenome]
MCYTRREPAHFTCMLVSIGVEEYYFPITIETRIIVNLLDDTQPTPVLGVVVDTLPDTTFEYLHAAYPLN